MDTAGFNKVFNKNNINWLWQAAPLLFWRCGRVFYTHVIGTETVRGARIGAQVFNNVNCVKINVVVTDDGWTYEHEFFTISSDTEIEYYCRGVGSVRSHRESRPDEAIDLKTYGTAAVKRSVVRPIAD